jgi:tRNA 2-selenouridine synthase SelU
MQTARKNLDAITAGETATTTRAAEGDNKKEAIEAETATANCADNGLKSNRITQLYRLVVTTAIKVTGGTIAAGKY